jgi:long-chain acyl-CoA synthetase
MPNTKNVYLSFAEIAAENPEEKAIIFTDMTITYGQLKRLADAFAMKMAGAGVTSKSTLMLHSADLPVVVATLLGASRLGAAVVQYIDGFPLPDGVSLTHHFHTAGGEFPAPEGSNLISADWSPALIQGTIPDVATTDDHAPWLFVFTSGTTGNPKLVGLSQAMVHDRSKAVADEFVAGKTRFACLFPRDSRPFMTRAFAALLNGATIVDGRDPDFWQSSGVTMVSGSVAQMVPFFRNLSLSPLLAHAEIMGAKPLASDVRLLLNSFETVEDVIGASEANKFFANVSTLAPDGMMEIRGKLRDSMIEIVDANGKPVPAGEEGVLRLKNKYLAKSYVGDREASDIAFRDGWFYPGDVASWGPGGILRIQNRDDNVINIRGVKLNALILDQIFRSVEGIRDAVCFKNPKANAADELFAFIVFEESTNKLQATESARFLCREKLGEAMVPRIIREVAGIPRKADGMPDRKACADIILKFQ